MNFNAKHRFLIVIGIIFVLTGCASDDDVSRTSKVVLSVSDKLAVLNDLQYQFALVVQVAELDGEAISDATVSLSIRPTGFYKGHYSKADTSDPSDGKADTWVQFGSDLVFCTTEDANNNGVLDAGEDINGNALLDPHIPTITPSLEDTPTLTPGTHQLVTDDSGFGYFSITYPKSEGGWVEVELAASVSGGLPENRAFEEITLSIPKDEAEEIDVFHAFLDSPYGDSANCSDAL